VHPFHLALPVDDLPAARGFYEGLLGCSVGRTDARWIDFNFFGHQLSVHLVEGDLDRVATNAVDGEQVPARHFGVVLTMERWAALRDRLQGLAVTFLIEPQTRFEGEAGEQSTMFILDPSGNALEFKAISDLSRLFATDD
jgi:extradiol dioxygenase family protein